MVSLKKTARNRTEDIGNRALPPCLALAPAPLRGARLALTYPRMCGVNVYGKARHGHTRHGRQTADRGITVWYSNTVWYSGNTRFPPLPRGHAFLTLGN